MKHIALILLFVLYACAASAAQFTLTWVGNSTNEDGFVIERAPGLNATTGFVAIGLVSKGVKTFVDPGLPASVPLSYRVFAYNVAGRSGYSNTASGTSSVIPAGVLPPSAPSGGAIQGDTPYVPPVIAINMSATVQGDKVLALTVSAKPEIPN